LTTELKCWLIQKLGKLVNTRLIRIQRAVEITMTIIIDEEDKNEILQFADVTNLSRKVKTLEIFIYCPLLLSIAYLCKLQY